MKGTLVATLVMVTLAWGITAPVLSVTVPRMAPVAPACPNIAFGANSRKNSPKLIRSARITGLLSEGLQQIESRDKRLGKGVTRLASFLIRRNITRRALRMSRGTLFLF